MQYYLAPLEGITTYTLRREYERVYGGISRYFTPFLASIKLSSRERNDILPEHNTGIRLIPQILTNRSETFLAIASQLLSFGYDTVNLNLGCPSGTVVSRHRGAGFLEDLDALDAFLEEIFDRCPMKISIKTRIGISSAEEWDGILEVYRKYPLEELIVHPRLQRQQYGGVPDREAYRKASAVISSPLCYNGDIISPESEAELLREFPDTDRIMIGRGVLRDPSLVLQLQGQALSENEKAARLRDFHDGLLRGYQDIMPGDREILFKLKDVWSFLGNSFPGCDRELKEIRKAGTVPEYRSAVRALLG